MKISIHPTIAYVPKDGLAPIAKSTLMNALQTPAFMETALTGSPLMSAVVNLVTQE